MGIVEKIEAIEFEMARTQKNKATEYHMGLLKARLAKLRTELLTPKSGGGKSDGFEVAKVGDARVALIGFPSVGKSSLLSALTETKSLQAAYEFTTLTCIPGNIFYKDIKIQLLDLPGIIEGAAYGKGRGRQVIAVAKSADLVMIVLDAAKENEKNHREILENELELVGLRLNKNPPNIYYKQKQTGGVQFSTTVKLTKMGDDPAKLVQTILSEYRIFNADVLFREDCSPDEFIDIIEGNRKYVKCLYVYNKIDMVDIDDVDKLARMDYSAVISVQLEVGYDILLEKIWDMMGLRRIYTKRKGEDPDFTDPLILGAHRFGLSVGSACKQIHKELFDRFNSAFVWGLSTKYNPQRVGSNHVLQDEDVIQINTKTVVQERRGKDYNMKCQAVYDAYKQKKKKKPLKT